ncbi:MAG: hypothetical protein KGL35_22660 [Bradyrhizobium sp.]|nr:hypothetical protein [Bradyrhizobium sp.]
MRDGVSVEPQSIISLKDRLTNRLRRFAQQTGFASADEASCRSGVKIFLLPKTATQSLRNTHKSTFAAPNSLIVPASFDA